MEKGGNFVKKEIGIDFIFKVTAGQAITPFTGTFRWIDISCECPMCNHTRNISSHQYILPIPWPVLKEMKTRFDRNDQEILCALGDVVLKENLLYCNFQMVAGLYSLDKDLLEVEKDMYQSSVDAFNYSWRWKLQLALSIKCLRMVYVIYCLFCMKSNPFWHTPLLLQVRLKGR